MLAFTTPYDERRWVNVTVAQPPWLKNPFVISPPSAVYMRQWIGPGFVQIMACRVFGASAELLSLWPLGTNFSEIWIDIQNFYKTFHSRKCIWKYRLQNDDHFVPGGIWVNKVCVHSAVTPFFKLYVRQLGDENKTPLEQKSKEHHNSIRLIMVLPLYHFNRDGTWYMNEAVQVEGDAWFRRD